MGVLNASKYYFNIRSVNTCKRLFSSLDSVKLLNPRVQNYLEEKIKICEPERVHVCDGTVNEYNNLVQLMIKQGQLVKLPKLDNCYLSRTDPADVARVESKTFIATKDRSETCPDTAKDLKCTLSNWMSIEQMETELRSRFPGCMKGRTMYVIPFSMGPVGSNLSKIGIQLTDSAYVVASMRIMTRMGSAVTQLLNKNPEMEFVKCLHSVGQPLPMEKESIYNWPCNPEKTIIAHIPERNEICSFGSGYGGNSLLGKKCFALRIGSILAKKQGWLAEHMLILGITNPKGVKKYIVAAFPSACGKTNLAMMQPSLPGYKVECVGDDIAWMKFDENGQLRAINPENGFFGVAPGTNFKTNPNAMHTISSNTIFTNVGETEDGSVFWEGMENEVDVDKVKIKTWLGEIYDKNSGKPAAHPNSRFCAPASQCPIIDDAWESSKGVPISAIIFGGRRPEGVPLVYEAFNWEHGVLVGAGVRSEATAAAEHTGKVILHDPFAMRPFFGYNFGHYLDHWLNFNKPHKVNNPNNNNKLPKIYHVNWFRKSSDNKFLWPGFGENSRVLDWICRRIDGEDCAQKTAIGNIPKPDSLNLDGLQDIKYDELFKLDKQFWLDEVTQTRKYFKEQVGKDLPNEITKQLDQLEERIKNLN